MSPVWTESELRRNVQACRVEYQRLNKDYDALVAETRLFGIDREGMMGLLREAKELGPKVSEALQRYHDSVAQLTELYSK